MPCLQPCGVRHFGDRLREIFGIPHQRSAPPLSFPLARLCNGDRTREDDDGSLICQLLSGCQFRTGMVG